VNTLRRSSGLQKAGRGRGIATDSHAPVLKSLSAFLQSECDIGKVLFRMLEKMRGESVRSSLQRLTASRGDGDELPGLGWS
jgi:hypothetical protein